MNCVFTRTIEYQLGVSLSFSFFIRKTKTHYHNLNYHYIKTFPPSLLNMDWDHDHNSQYCGIMPELFADTHLVHRITHFKCRLCLYLWPNRQIRTQGSQRVVARWSIHMQCMLRSEAAIDTRTPSSEPKALRKAKEQYISQRAYSGWRNWGARI